MCNIDSITRPQGDHAPQRIVGGGGGGGALRAIAHGCSGGNAGNGGVQRLLDLSNEDVGLGGVLLADGVVKLVNLQKNNRYKAPDIPRAPGAVYATVTLMPIPCFIEFAVFFGHRAWHSDEAHCDPDFIPLK